MGNLELLQIIWFILIGFLFTGYSVLDGFDLGVGSLLPFLAKKEEEKKLLFKAIGPFWDGNEVWLVTAGAALFAAFPYAYATVFSGFYLAFMLLLFSLIFRAVSLELWGLDEKRKSFWEWAFVIGSFLPSLLYGIALGNVVAGIPLDKHMDFTGSFFTLFRPFPLAVGILGLMAILLQGGTYAVMKSSGEVRKRARKIVNAIWILFLILLVLCFFIAYVYIPGITGRFFMWFSLIVVLVSWILLKIFLNKGNDTAPFYMSSISFIGLWGITGAVHFPNLVKSSNNHSFSLTIHNASSTELTLKLMFIIVLIGMPIVMAYSAYIYKVFKGKVSIEEKEY
ncbi:MAG: cytochrome d ubiquinol oxidase subunit II [Firmicutes bacterium]|nr:cytochrome d ubiquinol oxidase subunit II [Bacillota bacterium]